ncbi:hypothetical protein WAI453_010617 [Rhynchosporium graminicola]|uniref:Related to related molecular chaperone n=1 Tax=Rhynchosporium graminicola TaxID=2792576 RepID=A0A1E1JSC0_9HELO|nr:related to related molecular chaperone [Rhynchosporium commune]
MRPSLSLRRQLAQVIAPSRNFTTIVPRRTQLPIQVCCRCSRNSHPSAIQTRPQRRWRTTSSTQQSEADASIKANPIPQTHYEFFPKTLSSGPPPSGPFQIDTRELRREFLQLQAVAHPDRHPPNLKTRAEATSARINEAYKTLQNPLLRAQYLLQLRGIDVAEDESAKVDDPELLMEVLDAREEIESVEEERDLEGMKGVNEERIRGSEEVLDRAFREDDLNKAKEEAVRLRYWVNIKESLDGWEKGKPVVLVH